MSKASCLRWPASVLPAVFCLTCLTPSPALAKGCAESAMDQPLATPAALGGELLPIGVIMNSIGYTGNQLADSRYPQFTSVDIENNYLFASYWAGFGIWDLTDPENPVKLSLLDGWQGAFPQWSGISEIDQFVYTLDAPPGDDTLLAVGGISPIGLSIWDTRNKSAPVPLYQDAFGKEISQVYAATIGSRAYAFAAGAFDGGEFGLFIYDMTEARNQNYHGCVENISGGVHNCGGVYVGKIGNATTKTQYVHGLQFRNRSYIVLSPGESSVHFVQIWDVTDPRHPQQVVSDFTGTGLASFTSGVAIWQQGNNAYLAVRLESFLRVFDVTSCLTGGCSLLPGPIANVPVATLAVSDNWKTVIFSRAGTTPMLFLGNHDLCHTGDPYQHVEYLFDMTFPAQPRDVTPAASTTYAGEPVDYWSYYYSDTVKGFAFSASREGKFFYNPHNGNAYLYRAALTLLDIHKWFGTGPPSPGFAWAPSVIYAGDAVTFTDQTIGPVTTRTWTFPDGLASAGIATAQGASQRPMIFKP